MDVDLTPIMTYLGTGLHSLPWNWIGVAIHSVLAPLAALHAMLYKRDSRAALGWVSVCLFFPIVGPFAYYMFGINRIRTRGREFAQRRAFHIHVGYERGLSGIEPTTLAQELGQNLTAFARVSNHVTSRTLTPGNRIELLQNGEQAYPAMLAAINQAQHQVWLISYLFESDEIGAAFVTALTAARQRGVDVRVIVDGIGDLYSWPRMSRTLCRAGIQVARFLPPKLWPPSFSINLRNHRKILVVDGQRGFTGGMNIGVRHLVASIAAGRTVDLHFRVEGPVLRQLQAVFAEDWRFASGEALTLAEGESVSPGKSFCRCISDGPNEDLDKISLIMMGAISAAQHSVTMITPYFLPSREMIASLQSAALRGVEVVIILPRRSNLRFVDWATRNLLWELLQHKVKVYYQPAPFAHTKLFVVDGVYAQLGSANLDPRSLRLNFELNLEVFCAEFATQLETYAQAIRRDLVATSLQEVDSRALTVRIRDALCWLLTPYL